MNEYARKKKKETKTSPYVCNHCTKVMLKISGKQCKRLKVACCECNHLFTHSLQCPMFKRDGDKEVAEPYADMAKFFTEARLLQRDVKLLLEGVSNQNVLATVLHPVS